MKFSELGVLPDLEKALAEEGINNPTPIQREAIPILLDGADATISSETGTGKTFAYLLPLFCRIDPNLRSLQALILVPTHELAIQIRDEACKLSTRSGIGIRAQALIGGASLKRQLEKLKQKPHLIVGSAGRIGEVIGMKKLKVSAVGTIVIDEADRMLYGDSLSAVERVLRAIQRDRQLVFVSATEQSESASVIRRLAPEVARVHVGCNQMVTTVEHSYLVCEERDKADVLASLIHAVQPERALVFAHRNENVAIITSKLAYRGLPTADLHSSEDKLARQQALQSFRRGKIRILVASDVAARGLDVDGVSHIINLDVPTQAKAYLHRAGRTGRAGATGCVVSLMTEQDSRLVKRFENELGISMVPVKLHGGELLALSDNKPVGEK